MQVIARARERAAQREVQKPSAQPVDWSSGEARGWLVDQLARAGVPSEYRDAVREKCRIADDLALWEERAETLITDGRGVIMFGPTGTGKSSTTALLAAEAIKVRKTVGWHYVPDLCDLLLTSSRARIEQKRVYLEPDVLVMDDFGARPFSQFEIGILDQVVENRYRRHKTMIVTSNIPQDELSADPKFARMVDRWRQVCAAWVIGGKSMRSVT